MKPQPDTMKTFYTQEEFDYVIKQIANYEKQLQNNEIRLEEIKKKLIGVNEEVTQLIELKNNIEHCKNSITHPYATDILKQTYRSLNQQIVTINQFLSEQRRTRLTEEKEQEELIKQIPLLKSLIQYGYFLKERLENLSEDFKKANQYDDFKYFGETLRPIEHENYTGNFPTVISHTNFSTASHSARTEETVFRLEDRKLYWYDKSIVLTNELLSNIYFLSKYFKMNYFYSDSHIQSFTLTHHDDIDLPFLNIEKIYMLTFEFSQTKTILQMRAVNIIEEWNCSYKKFIDPQEIRPTDDDTGSLDIRILFRYLKSLFK